MHSNKITIAIFGSFQNGKSTLVNCLTNSNMSEVGGMGVSVTHTNIRYTLGTSENITIVAEDGKRETMSKMQYYSSRKSIIANEIIIESKCQSLKYFDIIDTPGFNANAHDTNMAEKLYEEVDFAILLLRNKGISEQEKTIAMQLTRHNIPFTCIINCFDEIFDNWNPCTEQNEIIKKNILAELEINSIKPIGKLKVKPVYVVNLMWYWLSLGVKSQNRSILLCEKKIKSFWDEIIGTTEYSATRLKHASKVESFLKILKHKELRNYLTALHDIKDARYSCAFIIADSNNVRIHKHNIINSICEEISLRIEDEKRKTSQQLESYQKKKAENENLSILSLTGFLKMALNGLFMMPYKESELKHRLNYLENKKRMIVTFLKTI